MTNAKVWPVGNIVSGAMEIYYHRPFEIPAFATIAVSPDVLDRYVGVYVNPDAPVKFRVTRQHATLYLQPGEQKAAPLTATAEDAFEISVGVSVQFDAAKKQMLLTRAGRQRVFTKEN
jgi:hypothetical protein